MFAQWNMTITPATDYTSTRGHAFDLVGSTKKKGPSGVKPLSALPSDAGLKASSTDFSWAESGATDSSGRNKDRMFHLLERETGISPRPPDAVAPGFSPVTLA